MGRPKVHGMCYTSEYIAWRDMKQRCTNKRHKRYADWGGRGIKICDEWLRGFQYFHSDMGLKPTKQHSLDRVNNDGLYCKSNCRWATAKQQANNTRVTQVNIKIVEADDE